MKNLLFDLFLCILVSTSITGILFAAIRANAKSWVFLIIGLAPGILVYIVCSPARVYSHHGFFHLSIIYQMVNGLFPPGNPLFGGESLSYPWAHHLLVAGIAFVLKLSPPTIFAIINIAALALTMILTFKTARRLSQSRVAGIFAAYLSVFAITFFSTGPHMELLDMFTGLPLVIYRSVIHSKFTNVNSMPLGILFYALFLYSTASIFCQQARRMDKYILLVLSVLGAGFFYPQVWLAVLGSSAAICVVLCLKRPRAEFSLLASFVGCIIIGTLLLLPYFNYLSAGREGALIVPSNVRLVFVKSVRYSLFILPISLVLWWQRKVLWNDSLPAKINPALILLTATTVTALMYVFISVSPPAGNEYKYLLLSCLSLGIFAGIFFENLFRQHKILCFLIISSFLIPTISDWGKKMNVNRWRVSDPYWEQGLHLRHQDPIQDTLYKWISHQTPVDAIFIDTFLTIPVFGRRQLYIGLDTRKKNSTTEFRDGWSLDAKEWLQVEGLSRVAIEQRIRVADDFYDSNFAEISKGTVSELRRTTDAHSVYVVSRDTVSYEKLQNNSSFRKVFESGPVTVFEFLR